MRFRVVLVLVLAVAAAALLLLELDGAAPASVPAPRSVPQEHADPAKTFGFTVWRAGFPLPVRLSPLVSGRWYGFTRSQALERIVAKLQGNCTHDGWVFAKGFFDHAPAPAIPMMIEAMDRAFQAPERADVVENTVGAMGRMGRFHSRELADALLRALEHPKASVREAAMRAMATAGNADAVRQARQGFGSMTLRAELAWIRAVAAQDPADVESIYRELLADRRYPHLASVVVEQCLQMEPAAGARILGPYWHVARPELRPIVATVLHAAGDSRGTRFLQKVLRTGSGQARVQAIGGAARGKLDHVLDDVLKLSIDPDPGVREAVATVIAKIPGDNIDNVLATLGMDQAPSVRQAALRALLGRGRRELLDQLVDRIRNGSGTRLRQALADLSAAGDGQAIGAMTERFRAAAAGEARMFLQAIGRSRATEAFAPMREIFLGAERPVDVAGRWTTVTYTAELLPNLDHCHELVLRLLAELPRADYRRRAVLVRALGNAAAFGSDRSFAEHVYQTYRRIVLDGREMPQMRLLALDYLRKGLTLDDMVALEKRQAVEAKRDEAMRKAITSYLFEFF